MNRNPDTSKLIKNSDRTREELRKQCSEGGKKSGQVRRAKKTMKQMLDYLLEKEVVNQKGEKASTLEAISVSLIRQAMNGNTKAFEVIRDTIGEKISDQVNTTVNISQPVQVNKTELKEVVQDIMDLADEG